MSALHRGAYRDPLEIVLAKEARTCKGCLHAHAIFNTTLCMKGHKHGNRCKQYSEKVSHEIQVS